HTRFKCDWSSDVCSSDLKCAMDCAVSPVLPTPPPQGLRHTGDDGAVHRALPYHCSHCHGQCRLLCHPPRAATGGASMSTDVAVRSEERRVGKECGRGVHG